MKIIKEGSGAPKWSRQVTCTGRGNACTDGCGAVLEVEPDDLRFYNGSGGYFERPNAVVMRCPCCEGITDLEQKDWPTDYHGLKPFSTQWKKTGK